jgi:hypothetical protein
MSSYPALAAAAKNNPTALAELQLLRREMKRLERTVAKLEQAVTTVEIDLNPARLDQARVVADRECNVLIRDRSSYVPAGETVGGKARVRRYHYSAGWDRDCARRVRKTLRDGVDSISMMIID